MSEHWTENALELEGATEGLWPGPGSSDSADDILLSVLELANEPITFDAAIQRLTKRLQSWTGCDAVGIRLRRGPDYPYYETRGFSEEFVRSESSLCSRRREMLARSGSNGLAHLDCMCGAVIRGFTNPDLPFYTPFGSFWTNSTTDLLSSSHAADLPPTRNRCNRDGYESVALIPLSAGEHRLGLVQINDRRRGLFTTRRIKALERLAAVIANLALRHRQRSELERLHKRNEVLLREVNHRVKNNLIALSGMLRLEATHARNCGLDECVTILDKVRARTGALSVVHQILSGGRWGQVQLSDLVEQIAAGTREFAGRGQILDVKVEGSSSLLSADQAHNLGIIVHEVVANVLEHAAECAKLSVVFNLESRGEEIILTCRDTGPGFPAALLEQMPREGGLRLIDDLTRHSLAGVVEIANYDQGAELKIRFPRRS